MNWRGRFTLKDVYRDFDKYSDEVKAIILDNFENDMDKYYGE